MGESKSPCVSVVIPCYNAARYVSDAIQTVLDQGHDNLQILVTDDGSSDDSAQAIKAFGDRVDYVWQENGGICAARNNCLRRVTGDYIAFLDADDLWTPDSLKVRLDHLRNNSHVDLVYGTVKPFLSEDLSEEEAAKSQLPDMQAGRLAGSVLCRAESFFRVGFFDENLRLGETFDWLLRAKDAGLSEQVLDHIVLLRRVHDTNTVKKDKEINQHYLQALRQSLARRKQMGAGG